jgi:glucose dehydrogenase
MWKIGGGTVWGWLSYDPELDLVYSGTSNPGPWNPDQRPGDNKWTAALFARRPETGEAVWAYQWNPHDLYDYDGVNENVLLDCRGRARSGRFSFIPIGTATSMSSTGRPAKSCPRSRSSTITTTAGVD